MTSHESRRGHHQDAPPARVGEVALTFCFCGGELAGLEEFLTRQPGIRSAAADRTRAIIDVGFDPAVTDSQRIERLLRDGGYGCDCVACPPSCCQPGHPAAGSVDEITAHTQHPATPQ